MVHLEKGHSVSLRKTPGAGLGEIHVNLNWDTGKPEPEKKKFFGRFGKKNPGSGAVDLDLECMYELKNGQKGTVQALSKYFGSYDAPPYISLDGDDRSGANLNGENMRINGDKIAEIKRILIIAAIYSGVADWGKTNARITLEYPGAEPLIADMGSVSETDPVCGFVLLENQNDVTFKVSKVMSFKPSRSLLDKELGWGLSWVVATK